ncbi:YwpF family protein [Halalkalibacillus halophilus]|uniref:YwpF family protein n=1 Tax=Halalkalibacillus halophilus TaxID=392827 RepID=UPI00042A01A9|nr:YwpF family protein [Halalkalibacillus halophilus]
MKTFKLVSLEVLERSGEDLNNKTINMFDGLIIDREIEKGRWLIEAYMPKEYYDYFTQKKEKNQEFVVQVRITKDSNPKATILVHIKGVHEIEDDMNVVLVGDMVNREREQVEQTLQDLIEAGYQGESLLQKFREKNQESLF